MSTITLPIRRKPARAASDPAAVLATATQRAAALLGLNGAALARILGVSEATVSRIARGERGLAPSAKEGELALLLVRLYRSLDALVGNDEARRLAWMRSRNDALGGVPATLILSAQGLVAAVAYLDAMRAPV
ncbi:antitoxin Xre-like helix-turn-helix domain-containing protein [Piscinibacter sp.]|uniref:antitoxin Xre-like helix-turn-helix domain-containing protein n=1 Tax=Piscinibacter sp. TaxID=1903157 RepID=UPI0039E6DEDE